MLKYKSFIFRVLILGLGVSLLENGVTEAKENRTLSNCSQSNNPGNDNVLLKHLERLNCSQDKNVSSIEKSKISRHRRPEKRNRRSRNKQKHAVTKRSGEDKKLMSYFGKLNEKAGTNVKRGPGGNGLCKQSGCLSSFSEETDTSSGQPVTKLKCGVKRKHNNIDTYMGVLYEIVRPGSKRGFQPIVGITKHKKILWSSKLKWPKIYEEDTPTAIEDWNKNGVYKLTLVIPRDDCKKERGTYKCSFFLKLKSGKYQREESTLDLNQLQCTKSMKNMKAKNKDKTANKNKPDKHHHGHKHKDKEHNGKHENSGKPHHHKEKEGHKHHKSKNATEKHSKKSKKKKNEVDVMLIGVLAGVGVFVILFIGIFIYCCKRKKKKKGEKDDVNLDDMNDKMKDVYTEKKKSRENLGRASISNMPRAPPAPPNLPANRASAHTMNRAPGQNRFPSPHNVESQPKVRRLHSGLMNQIHGARID